MNFFFRGISFSFTNLMVKPYQRHIASWEGLCQFSCIKILTLNDVGGLRMVDSKLPCFQ